MTKVTQFIKKSQVDGQTGEILSETTTTSWNAGKEPDFVKIYLDNIVFLSEIPKWVSKVLYELLKSVTYAEKGQHIVVNPAYKRVLAETLGMKPQSVTNAINQLEKENILFKKDIGYYQLNPQFFGKGEWKNIAKLRYEIELSSEGKKLRLVETTEENAETKLPVEEELELDAAQSFYDEFEESRENDDDRVY